jgi:assimilatory nitrate reductase catalytic subunit
MTRSGKSETLGRHTVEPFVEVHPSDAHSRGLTDGGLARVESPHGSAVMRVVVSRAQKRGTLFSPIHWSAENASAGRIGAVVHPVTDPYSGQPDSKRTPVAISPVEAACHGFILSRDPIAMPDMVYWARTRIGQGWGYSVALHDRAGRGWNAWTAALFGADPAELIELDDRAGRSYRAALVRDGRLDACGFFSKSAGLPSWEWLKRQFAIDGLDSRARGSLLAGRPADGADPGPTVCACFAVGLNDILTTIREQRLTSVEAVGAALKAGTNCGSCLPEIKRIVSDAAVPASV